MNLVSDKSEYFSFFFKHVELLRPMVVILEIPQCVAYQNYVADFFVLLNYVQSLRRLQFRASWMC